jgi:hypothetical protein
MIVSFGSSTTLKQAAWSVGFCSRCNSFEAIRVGDAIRKLDISGLPVSREVIGLVAVCDCCDSMATPAPEARTHRLDGWTYDDGLRRLFELCAPNLLSECPYKSTEVEIGKLLKRVKSRTSVNALEIGPGMIFGALIGGAFGLIAGIVAASIEQLSVVGMAIGGILGGGFVGGLVGSFVSIRMQGRKMAKKMIRKISRKYQLPPDQLIAAARRYPSRIRRGARLAISRTSV